MILISPDQRLFHLLGKTFSYVLYIDDEGRLLDLYWKDPLGEPGCPWKLLRWEAATTGPLSSRPSAPTAPT